MHRCTCETTPAGRPDAMNRDQEAEIRIPNPLCRVHPMDADEYDHGDVRETYDLAWDHDAEEWIDAYLIDPDTGLRYRADATILQEMTDAAEDFTRHLEEAIDELDGVKLYLGGKEVLMRRVTRQVNELVDYIYCLRDPRDPADTRN